MAQKPISAFFKPSQAKRKQDDHDEGYNSQNKKFKEDSIEDCIAPQATSEIRNQIIALSKINPALSANIGLTWYKALSEEFHKQYFLEKCIRCSPYSDFFLPHKCKTIFCGSYASAVDILKIKLGDFLKKERAKYTVYPPEKEVYFWTNTVKIHDVKVIILGQDPYHGPNQAHGLAFSVRKGVTCPPSLKNIYKELTADVPGFTAPSHGYLYGWASQGVLLLNATLTVRAGCPNSHKDAKWNHLTDAVIKWIDRNLPNSVFMLWGKNAQEKMSLITKDKHLVLTAPHPSPFSADRGFFGCRHFTKANNYLKKYNKKCIDWNYLP